MKISATSAFIWNVSLIFQGKNSIFEVPCIQLFHFQSLQYLYWCSIKFESFSGFSQQIHIIILFQSKHKFVDAIWGAV